MIDFCSNTDVIFSRRPVGVCLCPHLPEGNFDLEKNIKIWVFQHPYEVIGFKIYSNLFILSSYLMRYFFQRKNELSEQLEFLKHVWTMTILLF